MHKCVNIKEAVNIEEEFSKKYILCGLPLLHLRLINKTIYVRDPRTGELIGPKTTDRGVPQGSVLSPLLFNIYVNDLKGVITNNIKLIQFADDVVFYTSGHSIEQMIRDLNNTMTKMEAWLDSNSFKLSIGKSAAVIFKKQTQPDLRYNIKIYGDSLENQC